MNEGEHPVRAENKERALENIVMPYGSRGMGTTQRPPLRHGGGENPKTPVIGCAISRVTTIIK